MLDFCLRCCSAVDLSLERMKKRDIRYVCSKHRLDTLYEYGFFISGVDRSVGRYL